MDGEPVRVLAALQGRADDSVARIAGAIDRAVSVFERLESPMRTLLYAVSLGVAFVSTGYFLSLSSKRDERKF